MKQKKGSFKCRRCGYCCMLVVLLSDNEIEKIKKLGFKEEDFVHTDKLGRKRIKMNNYFCYFLGLENGESFCRIYGSRPKACRDYPFFKGSTAECMPPRLFDLGQ